MKQVNYFTNIFPHYRKPIWELLINENRYHFNIFYSDKKLNGIEPISNESVRLKNLFLIKNYFLFGRLIWQNGVLGKIIRSNFEIAIFLGEMNILSTWIGAIICKLLNKKVIFWGHGLYGNENFIKKYIRIKFLKLADTNILYENRSMNLMFNSGFKKKKMKVIFNSLDYDLQLKLFNELESNHENVKSPFNNNLKTIIFVGRLTKMKKIKLLIDSLNIINLEKPKLNLLIVGNGPEKLSLEKYTEKYLSTKNFKFVGDIYDEKKLSKFFYTSSLTISPGNIGLTAIHSLSYGTPAVSHNNFDNQMPEVESIIDGVNGFLFNENDKNDLAHKILNWISKKEPNKRDVRKIIDEKYNQYLQKKIMDELILD